MVRGVGRGRWISWPIRWEHRLKPNETSWPTRLQGFGSEYEMGSYRCSFDWPMSIDSIPSSSNREILRVDRSIAMSRRMCEHQLEPPTINKPNVRNATFRHGTDPLTSTHQTPSRRSDASPPHRPAPAAATPGPAPPCPASQSNPPPACSSRRTS